LRIKGKSEFYKHASSISNVKGKRGDVKNVMTKFKISQKILNKKILYYSVLESSQRKLLEYAIKYRGSI